MSPSNGLLSTIGWLFVPNLLTSFIQKYYYKLTGKPVVASHYKYQQHRRNIYICVIVSYIICSIVDSYWSVIYEGGPFDGAYQGLYTVLGVKPSADYRQIKTAYRKLGIIFHPDKSESKDDATWHIIKSSHEVLSNSELRFGYDRFGYEVVSWKTLAVAAGRDDSSGGSFTMQDIILKGLWTSILTYYLPVLFSSAFLNIIGIGRKGQHARYYILTCALIVEAFIVTRSGNITLLRHLNLLQFQAISLMKRLLISIFIGINQLAPLFQTPEIDTSRLNTLANEVELYSRNIEQELTGDVMFEYAPFPEKRDDIKKQLVRHMIDLQLRVDPEVDEAIGHANEKLRNK